MICLQLGLSIECYKHYLMPVDSSSRFSLLYLNIMYQKINTQTKGSLLMR